MKESVTLPLYAKASRIAQAVRATLAPRHRSDIAALFLLMAGTVGYALWCVDFSISPFEDAAMLMRYADHVAHGHGIVWNIGEKPVDGATDFLFMIVVAAAHKAGLPLENAVRFLTVLSHFATVTLVYSAMRAVQKSPVVPAALTALYIAVGPGLPLCAAYFGTSFFVLFVTLTWVLAQKILLEERGSWTLFSAFALAGLVTGLIRPEGVIMAGLMAVSFLFVLPAKLFFRAACVFASVFLALGGIYFGWRWNYFGYPLPNPFYIKGGGLFYPDSLRESVGNMVALCFPFMLGYPLALRSRKTLRLGLAFALPITGSAVMWILLSNEMNFGGRFQYPLMPVAALSWYPLVKAFLAARPPSRFPRTARTAVLLLLIPAVGLVGLRSAVSCGISYFRDGRYEAALILRDYKDRNYTMAVTEAGLLPLFSQWKALDTWGLNDAVIAHHGRLTEAYLAARKPELIVWHGYFSPAVEPDEKKTGRWSEMIMTLKRYAETNNYTLAVVFGVSSVHTHYYYVRSDLPEAAEIISRLRALRYTWSTTGEICRDYTDAKPYGNGVIR